MKKFFFLLLIFTIFCTAATPPKSKLTKLSHKKALKASSNVWKTIAKNMNLNSYTHNPEVREHIRWYLAHSQALYTLTKNAELYVAYITTELQKRGMPLELALLPMIESSYNPTLSSQKGAVGLWQMMPTTARDLGISINWWYDGRRDIIASTHAALDYLQYLHDYFKSWPLTFAAYNSGIGTVQKAIHYNEAKGLPTTYHELQLPQQTKNYVPKIIALAMILSNPTHYHLPIHAVSTKQIFKAVKLHYPLPLKMVARLAKCRLSILHKLNPGFKREQPSPRRTHYNILIPANRIASFNDRLTKYISAAKAKKINSHAYRVKPGDSLIVIAHQHHITLASLIKANHLNSSLIRTGQTLYLPHKNKLG